MQFDWRPNKQKKGLLGIYWCWQPLFCLSSRRLLLIQSAEIQGGRWNLDGETLTLDGCTLSLDGVRVQPRPPYNLSTALEYFTILTCKS